MIVTTNTGVLYTALELGRGSPKPCRCSFPHPNSPKIYLRELEDLLPELMQLGEDPVESCPYKGGNSQNQPPFSCLHGGSLGSPIILIDTFQPLNSLLTLLANCEREVGKVMFRDGGRERDQLASQKVPIRKCSLHKHMRGGFFHTENLKSSFWEDSIKGLKPPNVQDFSRKEESILLQNNSTSSIHLVF